MGIHIPGKIILILKQGPDPGYGMFTGVACPSVHV